MTQNAKFDTCGCYKATVNESETITDAKPAPATPFGGALTAGPKRS